MSITGNNTTSGANITNEDEYAEMTESIFENTTNIAALNGRVNEVEGGLAAVEGDITSLESRTTQTEVDTTDITYNAATDTTTIENRLKISAPNTVFTGVSGHPAQLEITNSWTGTSSTTNSMRLWVSGYYGQSYTAGNKLIQPGDAVISIYDPSVDSYTGSLCLCPLTHSTQKNTSSRGVRMTFTSTGDTYFFGARNIIYRTESAGAYVAYEQTLFSKDKITGLTIDVGDRIGLNGRNIDTLTTRVTATETVNATQTTNIAANTAAIAAIATDGITANASAIAALTTRVSAIEATLSRKAFIVLKCPTSASLYEMQSHSGFIARPAVGSGSTYVTYDGVGKITIFLTPQASLTLSTVPTVIVTGHRDGYQVSDEIFSGGMTERGLWGYNAETGAYYAFYIKLSLFRMFSPKDWADLGTLSTAWMKINVEW